MEDINLINQSILYLEEVFELEESNLNMIKKYKDYTVRRDISILRLENIEECINFLKRLQKKGFRL